MPTNHNYMLIIGKNHLQNQNIVDIFNDHYKPIIVQDISKAIESLEANHSQIGIVMIDDSMDKDEIKDFLDFCLSKHLDVQIPMVFIDGTEDDELYNLVFSLKIDEVIRKPYNPNIFKARVLNLTALFSHKYRLQWLVDTQTKELRESIEVLNQMRLEVLESLGTLVEFRSIESGEHIYRVRFITELLMQEYQQCHPELDISNEMIHEIGMASILHDIGKISVSDTILNKPARLTEEEFNEMKKHTMYGCEIIKQFKGLYNEKTYQYYYDVIRSHHEKWDGKGYPDGLKKDEIPLWAQIVSVADIYDALTNTRVYKSAYHHSKAVKMIYDGECGMINPEVLDCFKNIENEVHQTAQALSGEKIESFQNEEENFVMHNLERERSYHRAYTELLSDCYFEYDSEYRTLQHYNILGRVGLEKYHEDMYRNVHPDDIDKLKQAINQTSSSNPTLKLYIRIRYGMQLSYMPCLVTIRTTWDIYTNKRIGGVGKIEIVRNN